MSAPNETLAWGPRFPRYTLQPEGRETCLAVSLQDPSPSRGGCDSAPAISSLNPRAFCVVPPSNNGPDFLSGVWQLPAAPSLAAGPLGGE